MQVNADLDRLLQDRFEITTTDFVAALRALPAMRPSVAALTEDEAHLLDDANFTEDRDAFLAAGTDAAGHAARLAVTSYTAEEVAAGLGVTASRVRQKRLAGELWAIPDGHTWLFPVLQFETTEAGVPGRQIRGLDKVFKALPTDLHPVAIAEFLTTPQPTLFHDRPMPPVQWLRDGGQVQDVIDAATSIDWFTA